MEIEINKFKEEFNRRYPYMKDSNSFWISQNDSFWYVSFPWKRVLPPRHTLEILNEIST